MFAYTSGLSDFAVSPNSIAPNNADANVFTFTFTHTSTADICFGGWHDSTFSHPHKWYYVEIYNGETLLGNFIPCYRKADNVNGFYDLVSGAFYGNAGVSSSGSAFTFEYRGPDVTPGETNYYVFSEDTLNKRIGSSAVSSYDGMVTTGLIPVDSSMNGKNFAISGVTPITSATYNYVARIVFCNADGSYIANTTADYKQNNYADKVGAWDTDITTDTAYIRISLVLKDDVALTAEDVANLKITLE